MSAVTPQLPVRLACKPSLWSIFCGRLFFAVVWAGFFVIMSWLAWHRRVGTPGFVFVLLVIFDLIALVVMWDIVVRFWRTLHNRHQPIVEIDRGSLGYGDTANVRVVEPHPGSIAEMSVKLVGECWSKSMTDFSQHRQTLTSYARCYEHELIRLTPSSDEPLSRLLKVQLPKSPPSDNVSWRIVVALRLKGGGVVEHPFPLRVRAS